MTDISRTHTITAVGEPDADGNISITLDGEINLIANTSQSTSGVISVGDTWVIPVEAPTYIQPAEQVPAPVGTPIETPVEYAHAEPVIDSVPEAEEPTSAVATPIV